jgi:hypothetical protein
MKHTIKQFLQPPVTFPSQGHLEQPVYLFIVNLTVL